MRPKRPRHPFFFFLIDTATTAIYTLSLHDALPISPPTPRYRPNGVGPRDRSSFLSLPGHGALPTARGPRGPDRKSTRLNSSHPSISYAVFCLKKKTPEKALPTLLQSAHRSGGAVQL